MVGLDAARYGLCLPGAEVKALCALMPPKYQAFERGNGMEMVWGSTCTSKVAENGMVWISST